MSDPKRATLITVGAPKSAKANVNKTVRLTINLDESNESKYPELNYKELVIAEEKKKCVQNGKKTGGLDPFSDNDDDVERVARKFEQKYGGKSMYGRKGRRKRDDFADIGAGYDENDSFIDNTHGYDEMIPPECDTFYGGFYINSGSLEFKTVSHEQSANSDEPANRRNKRRISSSSSEEESSESSSESESQDGEKDPKAITNGAVDSHKTEHRKKKNKKIDKKKASKVQRTDSSAATSGKQTSDDNVHADGESADCADSRTSQSDSLTSKPAPSSENPITSDSSRDVEAKSESKLPASISEVIDALETTLAKQLSDHPTVAAKQLVANNEAYLLRLDQALKKNGIDSCTNRTAWNRVAAIFGIPRAKVMQRVKLALEKGKTGGEKDTTSTPTTTVSHPTPASTTTATTTVTTNNKRKYDEFEDADFTKLTDEKREAMIVDTLQRLKALIEERKPSMLANYNAECEKVQEERKKLQVAKEGGGHTERRLPKRRFPWCGRARALLGALAALGGGGARAAALLAARALPLFPSGFVRMPTLLRQADLNKEIKVSDIKRQRLGSASQPPTAAHIQTIPQTTPNTTPFEPIQFPSSLTVTTTVKTPSETNDPVDTDDKYKTNSIFGSIMNSFTLGKDLIVEKDKKDENKEDPYIPPNNIGSITITPVPNQSKDKKNVIVAEKQSSGGLIRVKSPAALNDMVNKKDVKVIKKQEKLHSNKRVESPLHIDTSYQPNKKDPSPKSIDGNYNKKDPSPKNLDGNYNKKDPTSKNDGNYVKKDLHKNLDGNYNKKEPSPKNIDGKKEASLKNIDQSHQHNKKDSTKSKDDVSIRQIESMRVTENNIPRPALVPVHHSPTFVKPDKRPPEPKKKKDVVLVSDMDPLGELAEPFNIDDSSSDVELIETTEKSDSLVPLKDIKSSEKSVPKVRERKEDDTADSEIDMLMRNIREMEHSQEPTKFNSNSYGGVITSAKHEMCSQGRYVRDTMYVTARNDKDKLTERTSLNKIDGSNAITG